jgi:hypothetical protein
MSMMKNKQSLFCTILVSLVGLTCLLLISIITTTGAIILHTCPRTLQLARLRSLAHPTSVAFEENRIWDADDKKQHNNNNDSCSSSESSTRRGMLLHTIAGVVSVAATSSLASAEVGTLPELADTNAILQGITVNVADISQQNATISFLQDGFDFKILRTRRRGTVEETWLGYGPEQLSIPRDFQVGVSSFAEYGGHASVNVRYDSSTMSPLYRPGDDAPGNNIAYLQLGVPGYRISQMVANGGKILDAYGLVNVVSPAGLPIRGIVGISPDPIMLVAVNCRDVEASKSFYEQLGFVETEIPYSRPTRGTTLFEPAPPKGSCYMSPSKNCMGILLLPSSKRMAITANPVVQSLNIVYKPLTGNTIDDTNNVDDGDGGGDKELTLMDPSNVAIQFQSASDFVDMEKSTHV